ncbi:hypothetical protein [Paraburkholderia lycopersici]|uniref:Uncharacterized protein n=1 Tax=Paraburkholderia lycopersici TaxID=416944 RepID=A0A1G6ZJ71_9BURK|nr:hypothetical protein [Paraburkholderia lycopersici]SDE01845.1 hypothetical protein SAMN05421548_13086 [Paraburkholderia lycopersici]
MKGANEGCALKTDHPLWVPRVVCAQLDKMECSPAACDESDLAAARRLANDPAMESFYRDPWVKHWTPECWVTWYDFAWHAASFPYDNDRRELHAQRAAIVALRDALSVAADAMENACDHRDGPASLPLEFADSIRLMAGAAAASPRRNVAHNFETFVEPKLKGISQRFDLKYIPDACDLLSRLADLAESWLSVPSSDHVDDPAVRAAIRSRKASDVPEYVRWFDSRMDDEFPAPPLALLSQLSGSDGADPRRLPDRLLALQCRVALGWLPQEALENRVHKARNSIHAEDA